jgi:DNA-binding transcriptional LysR family regulator
MHFIMASVLDSRQLRAFAVLARTGSFTQAARELRLTQSAISHAIKALEADVGCLLLDRIGKKTTLTQAGEQLLMSAERILSEMESVREELKQLGRWGSGRLRLGAPAAACQYLLPAVLREFRESFPACRISIEAGDTSEVVEMLHARRIDLALVLEPRGEPQIEFRHLFTDELQFVVSQQHPWAQAGKVDEAQISRQSYILYDKTSYTFQMIEDYFESRSLALFTFVELGSMDAIKELVKLNLGVSILAPWVAQKELGEKSLFALPLGRRKLTRKWGIIHWRDRRLTLAEETFIGLCQSATEQLQTGLNGSNHESA